MLVCKCPALCPARVGIRRLLFLVCLSVVTGCAFDVSYVRTTPVTFTAQSDCAKPWVLQRPESVGVGSGFATFLKPGTSWHCLGSVPMGQVFATRDQIVTVEASNIYEAQLVVSDGRLVGFYLPVDRAFVAVNPPVSLQVEEKQP